MEMNSGFELNAELETVSVKRVKTENVLYSSFFFFFKYSDGELRQPSILLYIC